MGDAGLAQGDGPAGLEEMVRAKRRFGLPADTRVVSCDEAGRDGYWLHRFLKAHRVDHPAVGSSSIEVKRRQRRAKTDRLDVHQWLTMLLRQLAGERKVWSVVRAPSVEEEDRRQLHRELLTIKRGRTRLTRRLQGDGPPQLCQMRQWDGSPLPPALQARLEREGQKGLLLTAQLEALEAERRELLRTSAEPVVKQVRQVTTRRGIGTNRAWLSVRACLAWREFRTRKPVGAWAGLTPTPHPSGQSRHELGIAKAGNRHIRAMAIASAWGWWRFQPESERARWYQGRCGQGSARVRKLGLVALARRWLIALWQLLETGVLPKGAWLKAEVRLR